MLGLLKIDVWRAGFKLALGPLGFCTVGGATLLVSDSVAWSCVKSGSTMLLCTSSRFTDGVKSNDPLTSES